MTDNQLPLWQPSSARIELSNFNQYYRFLKKNYNLEFKNYAELYQWSIEQPETFWQSIWQFGEIKSHTPYSQVFLKNDPFYKSKWFPDATLNFAENLLRRNDDGLAIIFRNEKNERRTFSYKQLTREVARLANSLKQLGIKKGDRVAGVLPNMPETVIAMLATTSLGAIWSSCSPDFGIQGILDRFGQIEPKVLFTVDAQTFHGKEFNVWDKVVDLIPKILSLQKVVLIPYAKKNISIESDQKIIFWNDFLSANEDLKFTAINFNDPVYILYSSGTTGLPKCIVHGAGRVLIQHLKELILHTDVKENDVFFYYTTCGWMMWNWMVSSLAIGATLLLYDGSPGFPNDNCFFNLIDEEKINILGLGAKLIARWQKLNLLPKSTHQLLSLRTILSTGSPLLSENFKYAYENIKSDLCLSSISGGTDIVSCFALGNPTLPVYPGELQCRGLGLAVEIFNDEGKSVKQEKGELVCVAPFPAMPIGFWNDPDDQKFYHAYFDKFPNVWAHGDYAELTKHDGLIIYGRSDAVLNPGGVRIGTAEIYRQVELVPEVIESLVIGQAWKQDQRIILFVKLRDGVTLNEDLKNKIKKSIRDNASPRHVPAKIIQVPDIPRTISGKIVELAVRDIVHGKPVKNKDALANPESLDFFAGIEELKR